MILIIHNNEKVIHVFDGNQELNDAIPLNTCISKVLLYFSKRHTDALLFWCHEAYRLDVDFDNLPNIFHHKRVLASYNPSKTVYLPEEIGYVEQSYFLKIKKEVTFPTWVMNSAVGGIHASVILSLIEKLDFNSSFNYFLNSLAKRGMVEGLFCYSEPKLLKPDTPIKTETKQATNYELYKFIKQHYKWVWVFFMFICFWIYNKKLTILPLVKSLFCRKLSSDFNLEFIEIKSSKKVISKKEIDVIIPTMGRDQYVYDVLKDFSKQTILPKNIIVVEQNADIKSKSTLGFLTSEDWPFIIKHHFIHKTGVCNARNLALMEVESEWTFLGDDDNRFESNLIENLFYNIETTGTKVGTTVYLQPNETQTYLKTAQTGIFGAGNSILKSELLKQVTFNPKYEFNYGEDNDFGMQLRHLGEDVIFFSDVKITHLKAPMGGYRTKVKQRWDNDIVKPKPSPTIMLLKTSYLTKVQLNGYKMLLFFRFYKTQKIKTPFAYIKNFQKRWGQSVYWSTKL